MVLVGVSVTTAIGLLLGALALALADRRRARAVVLVLAAVILVLGITTATSAAVCFAALACGLVVLDRAWLSDGPGVLVALIALLSLVERLLDAGERSGLTPMRLPTALAFVALGVGLLMARPDRGLTALVRADTPGGALVRRLGPAAIVIPIVLAYALLEGVRSGWYGAPAGFALYCSGLVVILAGLIVLTARWLDRLETARRVERAIVDATVDAVVTLDVDGRLREFNPAAERMFGRRRVDVLGREFGPLIVPEALRAAHKTGLARAVATGESAILGRPVVLTALRADGSEFPVEVTISRLAEGSVERFVGHIRDITERVADEQAVQRLAAIVESSPDAVMMFEPDGRVVAWNDAAEGVYGYSAQEMLGSTMDRLLSERPRSLEPLFARLRAGRTIVDEAVARHKDGREIDVFVTVFPITDEAGEMVAGGVIARDVTERRRLESQLRQAQKMEAVGQLAGGIAHDFNNLLTVITGFGDLARSLVGSGPGAEELEEIERAAQRASALTNQLLTFSRRQLLNPVALDVGEVARGLVPMLERLISEHIEVRVHTDARLPLAIADHGSVEQVIVNLAINARDAMPDGGTLTIEARGCELDGEEGPAPYVCLSVTDTGIGIDREALPHVFEPFYTTKAVGEGTGLGLAMVHGAVSQSGGQVRVSSELGVGTSFTVFLPVVSAPTPVATPVLAPDADGLRGGETLLLCEDEDSVRALLERVLAKAGYRVLSAARPLEALEHARAEPEHIHGLISDVIMPDMPGPELARQLQELRPGVRTLFVSGYTADTVNGLPAGSAFLEKPFNHTALLRTLRDLLDRDAG